MGFGFDLFMKDRMTGALPEGQSERDDWTAKGKSPYSIRIGKRWHPVGQIQPLGAILAFGASLAEGAKAEDKNIWRAMVDPDALLSAGGASVASFLDLPFVQGITDLAEAAREPERKLTKFAQSKASSLVPNVIAGLARATDPTVREINSLADAVLSRIPIASRSVPAKPGLFGEAIERERGTRDRIGAAFFNVTGSRRDNTQDDALLAELESIGYVLPHLNRIKGQTAEEYRAMKRLYGRYSKAAIVETLQSEDYELTLQAAQFYVQNDPRFAGVDPGILSDALRREMLKSAVRDIRGELTTQLRMARAG